MKKITAMLFLLSVASLSLIASRPEATPTSIKSVTIDAFELPIHPVCAFSVSESDLYEMPFVVESNSTVTGNSCDVIYSVNSLAIATESINLSDPRIRSDQSFCYSILIDPDLKYVSKYLLKSRSAILLYTDLYISKYNLPINPIPDLMSSTSFGNDKIKNYSSNLLVPLGNFKGNFRS